jgi:hypothetical protein
MEQTQTKQNGRPKLDLKLGQTEKLTLMRDKPYVGESSFGPYYLYQVSDQAGVEYSFFAPAEVHQQILEAGLKAGDSFQLSKRAQQVGKKVSARLEFEAVKKNGAAPMPLQQKQDDVPSDVPDDRFKVLMKRCVQEAVEIVKEVNTIPWQNEDVRSIALTMFIQRAKIG